MNRIEKILEDAERKLVDAKGYSWEDTYAKQVGFFKWLLEEVEELPSYELHQPRVEPSVWGMGDVSFHIRVQLQDLDTRSHPVVLIFDYQSSTPTAKKEKSE